MKPWKKASPMRLTRSAQAMLKDGLNIADMNYFKCEMLYPASVSRVAFLL
jgi:hypothetical protein